MNSVSPPQRLGGSVYGEVGSSDSAPLSSCESTATVAWPSLQYPPSTSTRQRHPSHSLGPSSFPREVDAKGMPHPLPSVHRTDPNQFSTPIFSLERKRCPHQSSCSSSVALGSFLLCKKVTATPSSWNTVAIK